MSPQWKESCPPCLPHAPHPRQPHRLPEPPIQTDTCPALILLTLRIKSPIPNVFRKKGDCRTEGPNWGTARERHNYNSRCARGGHRHPAYKALAVGPPDTASHSPLLPPGPQCSGFLSAWQLFHSSLPQAFHMRSRHLLPPSHLFILQLPGGFHRRPDGESSLDAL